MNFFYFIIIFLMHLSFFLFSFFIIDKNLDWVGNFFFKLFLRIIFKNYFIIFLASLRQEIGSQQSRPPVVQDETPHDLLPSPPPPPVPMAPQTSPYMLHGHSEVTPPVVAQATIVDDVHACMDRIEQCMR